MSINIQLKLGNYPKAQNNIISSLLISLKQSDISKTLQKIKTITSTHIPNLILKIPKSLQSTLAPSSPSSSPLQTYLQKMKVSTRVQTIQEEIYLIGSYNQEILKFINKLQHLFKDIPKLDNYLRVQIQENKDGFIRREIKDAVIKVEGVVDSKTVGTVKEALKEVSPGFLNSPIVSLLEIFIGLECKLEIDDMQQLPEYLKGSLKPKPSTQKQQITEFTKKLQQLPQQIDLTFCIPNLLSIEGTISSSLLSIFLLKH